MALAETSLDGPASSWFNSLTEIDTQGWSIFSTKFLKHFDIATIKFKTQADAQITHESTFIYACRVEDLVENGWAQFDPEMKNREYIIIFKKTSPI